MANSVALFPTCLVDLFRPSVGFACISLLEKAGYDVHVPEKLTCCGQPAFNSGDRKTATAIAKQTIDILKPYKVIVIPSGSCGGMVIKHYQELFAKGSPEYDDAIELSERMFELTHFLSEIAKIDLSDVMSEANITYHDSCSGYRELGVEKQPRKLIAQLPNISLTEMTDSNVCCGFGGTFCVKYPEISNAMLDDKTKHIDASGADILVAGDLGCLMNMAGKMSRENKNVKARHIAEVLAGDLDTTPAIGEGAGDHS